MSIGIVVAVSLNPKHTFSKLPQLSIHLLAGLGVEGDAHCGSTVRHRYLVRRNPAAPNRTQVHLLEAEFLEALATDAPNFPAFHPGDFGENILTRSIRLISLPLGTRLHLGPTAIVELTGLRSPCKQMNTLRPGLMKASFVPGTRRHRAGVMAVVLEAGTLSAADTIHVELPPEPHIALRPV